MLMIFIDESGIHKQSGHSSFVLVYVFVKNVELLEKKIKVIEKEIGISHFHWSHFSSKRGWNVREEFLNKVSRLDFHFKVAVVKNPIYFPKVFESCLHSLITEKEIKKIVIDGKKPKWYERRLKKTLRDKEVSVKKLKTAKDEAEPALRLADALAGLVRSYYDKPTERTEHLYGLLKKKITTQLVGGQRVR